MAKRRKKGMRRGYLKKYGAAMVNTGSNYNSSMNAELRTKLVFKEEDEIRKMFRLSISNPNKPRSEVLKKIREMANNKPLINHVCVHPGKLRRLFIFYNTERTVNYFVEVNHAEGVVRYSECYHSRERAFSIHRNGERIRWVRSDSLPESAAEVPSPLP